MESHADLDRRGSQSEQPAVSEALRLGSDLLGRSEEHSGGQHGWRRLVSWWILVKKGSL